MPTTLKDVAARCNVHPSTVSRVLRGKENIAISDGTRKKILKAVKELNYQPDQTARALRLRKSNVIGLIIPNIASPFFSGIAKSIALKCHSTGLTLIVTDTNEDQEKEIKAVYDLYSRGVDGMIIAPVQEKDHHIQDLRSRDFPFVLIDRCFDDIETNAVINNDKQSAYDTISSFAALGHKAIGFVSGRSNLYTIRKRLEGYKKALNEYDLISNPDYISGGEPTLESGYESAVKLLSLSIPPTAFLISGTIITLGVIKAILEKGLNIPKDISIVGYTDTIYAPFLICPLSTISHDVQKIGNEAFNLLYKHMESGNIRALSKVVIETMFYERNSTGPALIK